MKLQKLTRLLALSSLVVAGNVAMAAPVAVDCSSYINATLAGGICTSAGQVGAGSQSIGVAATVSATGSSNLLSYGGLATTALLGPDMVLGSGTTIQYATGILASAYYLIYAYETSGNLSSRDFIIESVLGSSLIAGMLYTEGTGQGTVKWNLYTDPTTVTRVSAPGSLALASLALVAVGVTSRRKASKA